MLFQNKPLNYTLSNPTLYNKQINKQPQYQYGYQYKLQYRHKQQQHDNSLEIVNPQVNGIDGLLCSLDQGIQNKQINNRYAYNQEQQSLINIKNNMDVRPQAKFYLNQQNQQIQQQQQDDDDDTNMLQMVTYNDTLQQQIQQLLNQLNKQTQQTQLIMADMSANNLKISELRKIYQQKHEQSKQYDNMVMKQKQNYIYRVQDKYYNNNTNTNANSNNKNNMQLHRQQISLDQPINNTYTLQYPKQKYQIANTNAVNANINNNSINNSMNNSIDNNSTHVYKTYGKTMNNSLKGQCSTTTPQGTLASSSTLYSFYNNNKNNNKNANKKDINNNSVIVAQFTVFHKPHAKAETDHDNDDNQIDSFHNLLLDDLNEEHSLWGQNTKQNSHKLIKTKSHNQQNQYQYQHETSKIQKLFRNTMPVSMQLQQKQQHGSNKQIMSKSSKFNNNYNFINNSNSNSKAVYKKIAPTASWNQNNIIINNRINMHRKVSQRIDKTVANNDQRNSNTYQAYQQQQNKYNEQLIAKAKNSTHKYKRISIFTNMSTKNNNNMSTHKLNNNASNAEKPKQSRPSSTATITHNQQLQCPKTNTVNYSMMTPNPKQHNTDTNTYKQQSSKAKDSARNRSMKLVNIDVRNCK